MNEIVVTLPNRPGQVSRVAQIMGENKINILAVAAIAKGNEADVHLVVSDALNAEKILKGAKYKVRLGEVLLLELEHSPGELARLSKLIADAGVNIELLYGSGSSGREAQIVMGVDDVKKAKAALQMD